MALERFRRVYDVRYRADFSQVAKANNEIVWSYIIFDSGKFIHKGEAGTKETAKQNADEFIKTLREK